MCRSARPQPTGIGVGIPPITAGMSAVIYRRIPVVDRLAAPLVIVPCERPTVFLYIAILGVNVRICRKEMCGGSSSVRQAAPRQGRGSALAAREKASQTLIASAVQGSRAVVEPPWQARTGARHTWAGQSADAAHENRNYGLTAGRGVTGDSDGLIPPVSGCLAGGASRSWGRVPARRARWLVFCRAGAGAGGVPRLGLAAGRGPGGP
jgi:hypothetical protein